MAIKNKEAVLVILLTWKRLDCLARTLESFLSQTYKEFHVHVSHGDPRTKNKFLDIVKKYKKRLSITYSIDQNSKYAFRRFEIARNFVKKQQGDIVLFLDDDVQISNTYIEKCLLQYEAKSYKSAWAFRFLSFPPDVFNKERVFKANQDVNYCGTGVSVVDGTLFLNEKFFTEATPYFSYILDDIWLSFFVKKIGWSVKSLEVDFEMNGDPSVSLFKKFGHLYNHYWQKLFEGKREFYE
jgi:glycosyltransferase involved in cell wall biosynthesis